MLAARSCGSLGLEPDCPYHAASLVPERSAIMHACMDPNVRLLPRAHSASPHAGPSAQVTFENSDATAAAALAKSMRDTGGANIFVPGFGNAAIGSVKEFTVPVDAKLARCGAPHCIVL